VEAPDDIPTEVRARIEANALFDALREGDYASAARAQERLRALGWHVSRAPAPKRCGPRRQPRHEASGLEVGQ
jgi:hypothetical protein